MAVKQEKVYEKLSQHVGEDVIPIVKYLKDKKNISEFQIAEKVKYEVNQT